jgi:hypothetical protein
MVAIFSPLMDRQLPWVLKQYSSYELTMLFVITGEAENWMDYSTAENLFSHRKLP